MPDLVVHHAARGWLLLIEAVTSHGPVNPRRHHDLRQLFASTVPLVFVTAFLTRKAMARFLSEISWETEVWCADAPEHMIHSTVSASLVRIRPEGQRRLVHCAG